MKNYQIELEGSTVDIEAAEIKINQGNLYFFFDRECTQAKALVPHGKWEMLSVERECDAIQVETTSRVPEEEQAAGSEDVRGTQQDGSKEQAEKQAEEQAEIIPDGGKED